MTTNINENLKQNLNSNAENAYKEFNLKLTPTKYPMLGIRIPTIRNLAKQFLKENQKNTAALTEFFDNYNMETFEDVLLYGFILGSCNVDDDYFYEKFYNLVENYFDNWAHVDTILSSVKRFKKQPLFHLEKLLKYKDDAGEFTKRTFVIFVMDFMLYSSDDAIFDKGLTLLTTVKQGQYYVDMGIAWAVSMAIVKNYEKSVKLLETNVFGDFTHNKSIQKCIESFRVTPQQKEYLRSLKRSKQTNKTAIK